LLTNTVIVPVVVCEHASVATMSTVAVELERGPIAVVNDTSIKPEIHR